MIQIRIRIMLAIVAGCLLLAQPCGAGADAALELEGLDVLELESAQRLALRWNPSIQAARSRLLQAQARVAQARAAWWPRLDGSLVGSRVRTAENVYRQNLQIARMFDPEARPENPANYMTVGMEALWLVFDGFERKFAHAAARLGVAAGEQALRESQRQLLSAVGDVWFQALLAREEMAIAEADQQFNQRLLEDSRALLEAGAGPLSNVLNFEIRVNAAESNLIRARQAYSHTRSILAALLGLPNGLLPENVTLAMLAPEDDVRPVALDAQPLLAYARQHRPDVQQMQTAIDQAQAGIGMARARFYPSLHLAGNLEARREADAYFEGDDFGNMLALKLTYNFLDGGYARSRLREARLQEAETRETYRHLQNLLASEVMEALESVTTARAQLTLQRANMVRVEQTRDLVEDEYKAGQSSLVRLNEAQRDLTTARSRLALARVSLHQSRHHLDSVTGAVLERVAD